MDRVGGTSDHEIEEEEAWQRRILKRTAAVSTIKASDAYIHLLNLSNSGELAGSRRPTTPDPTYRQISKRDWERRCMTWRTALRSIFAEPLPCGFANACLVDSLRRLGVPVLAQRDGPFWALHDGNAFLEPFGLQLIPIASRPLPVGRYVVWTPSSTAASSTDVVGHFVAVHRTATLLAVLKGFGEQEELHETDLTMFYMLISRSTSSSSLDVLGGGLDDPEASFSQALAEELGAASNDRIPISLPDSEVAGNPHLSDEDPPYAAVPRDGLCLYHCMNAAKDLKEWVSSHNSSGIAFDKHRVDRDIKTAQSIRAAMVEAIKGDDLETAERLAGEGVDAYPSQDEFGYVARLIDCITLYLP